MDKIICTVCGGVVDLVQSKTTVEDNILTRSQIGYCEKCGVRHDWEEKFNFIEQKIIKVWTT